MDAISRSVGALLIELNHLFLSGKTMTAFCLSVDSAGDLLSPTNVAGRPHCSAVAADQHAN